MFDLECFLSIALDAGFRDEPPLMKVVLDADQLGTVRKWLIESLAEVSEVL